MAFTGKAVVVILAGLSIYSYAVMVDRGLTLRWTRQRSAAFAREIEEGCLMLGEFKAVQERARRAEQDGPCTLAVVISATLAEYELLAAEGQADAWVMEAVDDALGRALDSATANLRVRLSGMATIVGVAPFLGLFGTVTGLIAAFRGIATAGGGGIAEVSGGISEALVTTVIGLFVAMPALWAYNFFTNRIEAMSLGLENNAVRIVGPVVRRALKVQQQQ